MLTGNIIFFPGKSRNIKLPTLKPLHLPLKKLIFFRKLQFPLERKMKLSI